jgi:hypothetical protein
MIGLPVYIIKYNLMSVLEKKMHPGKLNGLQTKLLKPSILHMMIEKLAHSIDCHCKYCPQTTR